MPTMMRLEKLEGFGNVQMVESEVPTAGPDDVVVEVKRSLISRGSELFARYVKEIAVSPERMGWRRRTDFRPARRSQPQRCYLPSLG